VNLGVRSKINNELLMNIFYFISIVTFGMELVCLCLEMSKEFVASMKLLSMSKTFNLSMFEYA
jgi:hypothetical protein